MLVLLMLCRLFGQDIAAKDEHGFLDQFDLLRRIFSQEAFVLSFAHGNAEPDAVQIFFYFIFIDQAVFNPIYWRSRRQGRVEESIAEIAEFRKAEGVDVFKIWDDLPMTAV